MSSFTQPLQLEYQDGRRWLLIHPFTYEIGSEGSGRSISVPAGFVTDFASVPRFFWRLLPPTGKYGKASVLHDYLYQGGGVTEEVMEQDHTFTVISPVTRKQADDIFLEAMIVLGVNTWTRRMIYWGVRMGGKGPWVERK